MVSKEKRGGFYRGFYANCMSLSSAIFFSESFKQNSALLSEFEFQKLLMRPGAAPTIALLERKPFSKALIQILWRKLHWS